MSVQKENRPPGNRVTAWALAIAKIAGPDILKKIEQSLKEDGDK